MTHRKKLMIIEDDEVFVFITMEIIKDTGYPDDEITVSSNGKEAIAFLKTAVDNQELLPEVIFLDLNMPVMDGWEFLDEFTLLKHRFKHKVTVYIVSSSVSPHDVQRAKDITDVSDFIVKPVTKERFIEIVKAV
jgi:CheY-like chemotaxis protein